jgi:hypothetical protein
MSQRPPASRPASYSPPDGQNITLPPVQLRDDAQQGGRQGDPQPAEQPAQRFAPQASQSLPSPSPQYGRSLQPAPSGEDWRLGPSRDLAVHSILNPTEPEDPLSFGRRVSGGEGQSPLSAVGPPSQFGASPSIASQHTFPGQQAAAGTPTTQSTLAATFPMARPILAPRSPRSFSLGRGRGQVTVDAARSPFLPGRARGYNAEPGQSTSSDVAPLPTPPGQMQSQQHYGFPSTASTPSRTSTTMQAPLRTPHSESTSPNISQSSQNPSSQTSPASYLDKGVPPPRSRPLQVYGGYSAPPPPPPPTPPPPSTQQQAQPGITSTVSSAPASTSSRQTSASDPIQVLRITTSQGVYNVPVDVHQASRLADEKRARNAGASARFRQRRKEKEREANTMIENIQKENRDLERKLREVEQERDFYRAERDRFRDVVFRSPDTRHLAMQTPTSPQSMRSGSFPGPGMAVGGPPPPPSQQGPTMGFQQEAPQERAPRRRRTGTSGEFASVSYTRPPASTLPPVQSAGYPAGPTSLPPLRIENPSAQPPSTTGPNLTPITSAGPPPPFGPYTRGPPGPYERGWPSERGGRR